MATTDLALKLEQLQQSLDSVFLLITTFCIFFMQAGFLLLETGAVRQRNSRSIMMKNICDGCFGAIGWYIVGYTIYSDGAVFLNESSEFVGWFQSYAYAITTSTIVSGGVACRMKFVPYMIYSFIMCAWVYPWIAKWCWGGWLADRGYLDFAGSGPVHLIGGVSAFIGAYFMKPRVHRFGQHGEDRGIRGHSDKMIVLGAFILWFGWFSFNAGSSGGTSPAQMELSNRAAMNTLIASAAAGVSGVCISIVLLKCQNTSFVVNAILGGLVAITAGCAFVDTWAALVVGIISPLLTFGTSQLLSKKQIDDPLDATAVHGVNGLLGVIGTGLFDRTGGLLVAGGGDLIVTQLLACVVMIAWSALHGLIYFGLLARVVDMRVSRDIEMIGIDFQYCDGLKFDELDGEAIREHLEIKQATKRMKSKYGAASENSISRIKSSEKADQLLKSNGKVHPSS